MSPRKKQDWTPATEFKITKLRRNGPKKGQSYEAWARGKQKNDQEWEEIRDKNLRKLI